jgi:hypothetical protein
MTKDAGKKAQHTAKWAHTIAKQLIQLKLQLSLAERSSLELSFTYCSEINNYQI